MLSPIKLPHTYFYYPSQAGCNSCVCFSPIQTSSANLASRLPSPLVFGLFRLQQFKYLASTSNGRKCASDTMFGTLAGIGGVLFLFHIITTGSGVGVKKEASSCGCQEELEDLRKEVEMLEEKMGKEMRAREELWLRDAMYAAELRERDERMEAYMAKREVEFKQRMEKTEDQLRGKLRKYLEEKENYLNEKEAKIESDLKESYERIEKDLKQRYAEIHLAQTEADKMHIR